MVVRSVTLLCGAWVSDGDGCACTANRYFAMWQQILRMCEGMVVKAMQMREDLYGFLRGGATVTATTGHEVSTNVAR